MTACERALQRLRPRLSWRQIPAVEEHAETALSQPARHRLHWSVVAPVVAEKDVERVSKAVSHAAPLIDRSSLTARLLQRGVPGTSRLAWTPSVYDSAPIPPQ